MLRFGNPLLKTRFMPFLAAILAVILFALLSRLGPQQLPVIVYKLLLPILGGVVACNAWLALMPYANPSRWLAYDWRSDPDADRPGLADFAIAPGHKGVFVVCVFCMTLAIVAGMLAVAWGL